MSRPRPVLTSAGITGLIQSIAGIFAFLGYSDVSNGLSTNAQALVSAAIFIIATGGNLLHGLFAQSKVTPISDPKV